MSASTSAESVCLRIAEHLAQSVGTRRYQLWFHSSAKLDYEDQENRLRVAVPNRFVADWIGRHFQTHLRAAASAELGQDVNLDVTVDPSRFTPQDAVATAVGLAANRAASQDGVSASDLQLQDDLQASPGQANTNTVLSGSLPASLNGTGSGGVDRQMTFGGPAWTARTPPAALPMHPQPQRGHPYHQSHQRPAAALRHRLADFIIGPSNELAFAAANRLVDEEAGDSGSAGNDSSASAGQDHQQRQGTGSGVAPVFIHGGCGLGKTHLLQGICRKLLDQRPDARVMYTTGEQFTNEFLEAVRGNKIEQFRKRIRRLDLLAVDDIHFIANKQATQQEFLHSFDAIEMSGARVALASDCHPKLIKLFSQALVSRCIRGMVVEVRQPDFATRVKIIQVLAQRRGLSLLDSAVDELAKRTAGSVREIEGTLTKLQALANLTGERTGEPIGHTMLHRLFAAQMDSAPRKVVRFDSILTAVADYLQVQRTQILGTGRHAHIVMARSLAIYLARQMTSMSFPELAAALGRNHHSTVITASQRVERQLAENQSVTLPGSLEEVTLSDLVERLRREIFKL